MCCVVSRCALIIRLASVPQLLPLTAAGPAHRRAWRAEERRAAQRLASHAMRGVPAVLSSSPTAQCEAEADVEAANLARLDGWSRQLTLLRLWMGGAGS